MKEQKIGKRMGKLFARIGISLLFIIYLILKVNWKKIFVSFSEVDVCYYALSTIITIISSLFIALKYRLLIRNTSIERSVLSLIRINFISRYYALFLPSALGREAVRWYKVTRNRRGRVFFLAATLFERSTFLFVLLLSGILPLLASNTTDNIIFFRSKILPITLGFFLIVCCVGIYFISEGIQRAIMKISTKSIFQRWIGNKLKMFWENFSLKRLSIIDILIILGLSIIWQVFFLFRIYLLFKANHLPLEFLDVAWAGSIVLLLQVLPISFAGLGVREGVYAYLLTLFGYPAEEGVLIGLLFFTQMLIFAFIGGVIEFIGLEDGRSLEADKD